MPWKQSSPLWTNHNPSSAVPLPPSIHSHKPPRPNEPLHQHPRRRNRSSPLGRPFPMPSIVQHDIRRPPPPRQPFDLRRQLPRNPIRLGLAPIGSHRVPRHHPQPQLPRNPEHHWPPRPKRRSKIPDPFPRNLLQSLARPRQLFPHRARPRSRQVWMAPRVIPNQVSLRRNAPHQFWLHLCPAPQHEERRLHPVFAQHIQQPRRPLRIRSVVKCQRQFARPLRCNQRRPKDPRPRPHRRIRIPSRSQSHGPNRAKPLVNPRCHSSNRHPSQFAALAHPTATAFTSTNSTPTRHFDVRKEKEIAPNPPQSPNPPSNSFKSNYLTATTPFAHNYLHLTHNYFIWTSPFRAGQN